MNDSVKPRVAQQAVGDGKVRSHSNVAVDALWLGDQTRLLGWCVVVALILRLIVIAISPDSESDAYGHFRIAQALAEDPHNLHVHWVWLLLISTLSDGEASRLTDGVLADSGDAIALVGGLSFAA